MRAVKLRHWYLSTVLFITQFIYCQINQFQFECLSTYEDLPPVIVNKVYQDHQGFLWLGMSYGLVRYDGYNPEIFNLEDTTHNRPRLEHIRCIIESKYFPNSIWIGAVGGIARINLETEKSFHYFVQDTSRKTTLPAKAIWSICESRRNGLWVGSFLGIDFLDFETDEFTHFLGDTCVKVLYEDNDGILWIGTWQYGLMKLDPSTGEMTSYLNDPDNSTSISNNDVESILDSQEDGKRIIWVGTREGLNKFDPTRDEFLPVIHQDSNEDPTKIYVSGIHTSRQSNRGKLWLSGSRLRLYDPNTGIVEEFTGDVDDPSAIGNYFTRDIFEDRSGLIWIATTYGLYKYNPFRKPFRNLYHIPNDSTSLSLNMTTAIHQTGKNDLWIGTANGLNHFDRKAGKVQSVYLKDHYIVAVSSDSQGKIWASTYSGLFELDPVTGQTRGYHYKYGTSDILNLGGTGELYIDQKDNVFVSASGGFYHLNRSNNILYNYLSNSNFYFIVRSPPTNDLFWLSGSIFGNIKLDISSDYNTDKICCGRLANPLSSHQVFTVAKSAGDHLWVATSKGLNKLTIEVDKPDSKASSTFTAENRNNEIILQDSSGAYFISDNVNAYNDYPLITVEHCGRELGFGDKQITGILPDNNGNLWLGTTTGLVKYNPDTESARTYDVVDGLPSNMFMPRAFYKNSDNEFFFGTNNGLTSFFPDSIRDNTHVPPVVLTGFSLSHKPIKVAYPNIPFSSFLPKTITYLDTLCLTHYQNAVSFEFAALDFHNSSKNKYAYRLMGLHDDWVYTSSDDRQAGYTNLDPGEYVFQVKGSNNDGIWNEAGRSLTIIITPPWWETTWAYVAYALLIGGVLFGAWRFQLSRVKLRHQLELERVEAERYQEIDRMKSRFFANISHEFRTPLTLILGPIEKLQKRLKDQQSLKDLGLMKKHTQRILNLVSQLLDLSKLEAQRMELKTSKQDIIPLLKGLTQSFTSLADKKNIELLFDSEVDQLNVYIQRDIIVKIINNLLSNAVKFTGRNGKVTLRLSTGDTEVVEIAVSDTGSGIPEAELARIFDRFHQVDSSQTREYEGTGIGLSLTKELVELHKGRISVQSAVGAGSTFTVHLPLGKDHLSASEIVNADSDDGDIQIGPDDELDLSDESDNKTINWESTWEILIVEDNADVRKYIRSYLEVDYRISEAKNGEDGLKRAFAKIPDLVISDIMMPKMDGLELCRQLKGDERTSHIPVILLTAKADVEDRLSGLEIGADDYLSKPFEPRELLVRIRNLIEQRRRLQDQFRKDLSILPREMEISSANRKFITKAVEIINRNLDNPDFSAYDLSKLVAFSQQHLGRKIKAITGLSTQKFIQSIRLRYAAELLKQRHATITEIAYQVGFGTPSHFTKTFHQEFGCTPSQFIRESIR